MVNAKKELREALQTVAPTYYELFLDSTSKVPCISYIEMGNVDDRVGDTLRYSRVSFTVKAWSHDVEELSMMGDQIDKVLRPLGYRRVGSYEMAQNNLLCKIGTYRGLGKEYSLEE